MSITSYSELQTALSKFLMREGDSYVSDNLPDLIGLAESRINYGAGDPNDPLDPTPFKSPALRVRQMQTRATATLNGEYMAVPNDFLEVISIKDNLNPERPLVFVSPHQLSESNASGSSGSPVVYTIIGDEFRFGPSTTTDTIELWYYAKVPALSSSNPVNWLLSLKPDIYLYGALVESASFTGEDERIGHWYGQYTGALRGLMAQDRRAKYGSTPLITRPVSPTP